VVTVFKPPAKTKRTGSRSINLIDCGFRSCGDFIQDPPQVFPDSAQDAHHDAQQKSDQRDQPRKPATSRYGPRIGVDFRAELGHAAIQAKQSLQVSLGDEAIVAQVLYLRVSERLDEVAATGLDLEPLLAQQFGKAVESKVECCCICFCVEDSSKGSSIRPTSTASRRCSECALGTLTCTTLLV
jgi:hypothetical protein